MAVGGQRFGSLLREELLVGRNCYGPWLPSYDRFAIAADSLDIYLRFRFCEVCCITRSLAPQKCLHFDLFERASVTCLWHPFLRNGNGL